MSKEDKEGNEQEFKQVIKIVRGNEQSVRITGDLCDPRFYMHASYQQALRALAEIVRQTDNFHDKDSQDPDDLNDALFCYNDNIIMFEGTRGRGKTQTMLSFTRILRNASGHRCHATNDRETEGWLEKIKFTEAADRDRLAGAKFHVIPPISPSVLEENQNILFLILSRLYDYAVNLLENARDYDEDDRNKLSRLFSACLSGIKGIKQGINDYTELSDLQTISDGAALRNRFYSLVQSLIQIGASKSGSKRTYLVVQIDDADSQIKNGYKAIEDIRKYLVIPNLIIVMSADITFLHKVIIHEQGKELDGLCHKFEEFGSELSQMSRKYIDKLIPPSHMIHLPKLEQLIENNPDSIVIHYMKEKSSSGKEEPVFDWMKDDWDIQNMLFMLIYRKTGVVFVRPSAYLHNIIPRSLRGLNQMLYFLSRMEDIPQLQEDAWTDSPTLALKIQEQLRIAMPNMETFERYFYSDWIEAKFHHSGDRQFIREFSRSAGNNRARLATGYLQKRYNIVHNCFRGNRIGLDAFMAELETEHREQEDFLLFFSIRTVLSLASQRRILQLKRKTIEEYFLKLKEDSEGVEASPPLLVFDYDPKYTFLPETYLMPRHYSENADPGNNQSIQVFTGSRSCGNSNLFCSDSRDAIKELAEDEVEECEKLLLSQNKKYTFLGKCMVCENEKGHKAIHFMNLITFMLRIGSKAPEIIESEYADSAGVNRQDRQYALYRMQEIALLIATNWDIQGYIYKYLVENIKAIRTTTDSPRRNADDIPGSTIYNTLELYEAIDKTLGKINKNEFRDYLMLSYRRKRMDRTVVDASRTMMKDAFQALLNLNYILFEKSSESTQSSPSDYLIRGLDLDSALAQKLVGAEGDGIKNSEPISPDSSGKSGNGNQGDGKENDRTDDKGIVEPTDSEAIDPKAVKSGRPSMRADQKKDSLTSDQSSEEQQ